MRNLYKHGPQSERVIFTALLEYAPGMCSSLKSIFMADTGNAHDVGMRLLMLPRKIKKHYPPHRYCQEQVGVKGGDHLSSSRGHQGGMGPLLIRAKLMYPLLPSRITANLTREHL